MTPRAPVGVLLAGGAGRRLGTAKAMVALGGRPLLHHPLAALLAALDTVVVVAKEESELPALPQEVEVWREPDSPRHPLTGIAHALSEAHGAVLVCAGDMPFVTPDLVAALAGADRSGRLACVARANGRWEPLLAVYEPGALQALRTAGPDRPLTEIVLGLDPLAFDVHDPRALTNVNTPDDLEAARRALQT